MFDADILQQFENAAMPNEKESDHRYGKAAWDLMAEKKRKNKSLDYEVEYILAGKSSDKANLETVRFLDLSDPECGLTISVLWETVPEKQRRRYWLLLYQCFCSCRRQQNL